MKSCISATIGLLLTMLTSIALSDQLDDTTATEATEVASGGTAGEDAAEADTVEADDREAHTEANAEATAAADAEATEQEAARLRRLQEEQEIARRFGMQLEHLEADGGAYNPALSEVLTRLGITYKEYGRYDEALENLQRAAHITRVNEGLYSSAGIPILEELITLHASLGQWEDVGARYQQMYRIHERNIGQDTEDMLPALENLSDWHMRAFHQGAGGEPINHLLSARSLYASATQLITASPLYNDDKLAHALRKEALVNYYLASYIPVNDGGSFTFSMNTGDAASMTTQENLVMSGYMQGRRALEQVVELRTSNPESTLQERVDALTELGDWHLLFSRRTTAIGYYKMAWQEVESAREAGLDAPGPLYEKPRALPILPAEIDDAITDTMPPEKTGYVMVQFSIGETGRANDFEVLEALPAQTEVGTELQVDKLLSRLRSTRFRPRFDNGEPVVTDNVVYKYTYPLEEV